MEVTQKEIDLIKEIYNDCFHDGQDPINHPVWQVADTKEKGGVFSSLEKKGLIDHDGQGPAKEVPVLGGMVGFTIIGRRHKAIKTVKQTQSTCWLTEDARPLIERLQAEGKW